MNEIEAKEFVLSIYPDAYMSEHIDSTIIFPSRESKFNDYLGYAYAPVRANQNAMAWKQSASNIKRAMLRKFES
jgi:hypothetical protein